MSVLSLLASAALLAAWGAQIYRRSLFVRMTRFLVPVCAAVFLIADTYLSFQTYALWQEHPISRFSLPPHQTLNYFVGYVGSRFFAPHLSALLAAVFIPAVARYLNGRMGDRFFEREETAVIGIGIFLTGYPGFLFYIPTVLSIGLLFSAFYSIRGAGRAPFYRLWLPVALFVIIMQSFVASPEFLAQFNL